MFAAGCNSLSSLVDTILSHILHIVSCQPLPPSLSPPSCYLACASPRVWEVQRAFCDVCRWRILTERWWLAVRIDRVQATDRISILSPHAGWVSDFGGSGKRLGGKGWGTCSIRVSVTVEERRAYLLSCPELYIYFSLPRLSAIIVVFFWGGGGWWCWRSWLAYIMSLRKRKYGKGVRVLLVEEISRENTGFSKRARITGFLK